MWNGDKEPEVSDEYWDDLDEEQRQAATVLGYDKDTWDKEGAFAKCCVILQMGDRGRDDVVGERDQIEQEKNTMGKKNTLK